MATHDSTKWRSAFRRSARKWLASGAVAACVMLAPLAIVIHWTSDTMLSTHGYVAALHDVPKQPEVAQAIAEMVVDEIGTRTDLPTASISGARTLLVTSVRRAVTTDQFQSAWVDANRTGHAVVIAALNSRTGVTHLNGGAVVLDVGALLGVAAEEQTLGPVKALLELASQVFTGKSLSVAVPISAGVFKLAQGSMTIIRIANVGLPVAGAVFGIVAVTMSRRRRRTLKIVTAGAAIGCATTWLIVDGGRALASSRSSPSAKVVADALTASLTNPILQSSLLAAIIAGAAWVAVVLRLPTTH